MTQEFKTILLLIEFTLTDLKYIWNITEWQQGTGTGTQFYHLRTVFVHLFIYAEIFPVGTQKIKDLGTLFSLYNFLNILKYLDHILSPRYFLDHPNLEVKHFKMCNPRNTRPKRSAEIGLLCSVQEGGCRGTLQNSWKLTIQSSIVKAPKSPARNSLSFSSLEFKQFIMEDFKDKPSK